jgi:hypothetical protein
MKSSCKSIKKQEKAAVKLENGMELDGKKFLKHVPVSAKPVVVSSWADKWKVGGNDVTKEAGC